MASLWKTGIGKWFVMLMLTFGLCLAGHDNAVAEENCDPDRCCDCENPYYGECQGCFGPVTERNAYIDLGGRRLPDILLH